MYSGDMYKEDYPELEWDLMTAAKIRSLSVALDAMCSEPHRVGANWVWFPNHGFYRHECPELFEYLDGRQPSMV